MAASDWWVSDVAQPGEHPKRSSTPDMSPAAPPGPGATHHWVMCTVVVSFEPGERMPLLLLGARDELMDRPWLPPARHWPGSPGLAGPAGLAGLAGLAADRRA